jgi:hypothetical protein
MNSSSDWLRKRLLLALPPSESCPGREYAGRIARCR